MQDNNTFEFIKPFPDPVAQERYAALVGIDHIKVRLGREAAIMLNPSTLSEWSQRFYKRDLRLIEVFKNRPPLFIFAGDVGTGKTALAETFVDQIARTENIEVMLYKLSLNARGSGVVGEMTKLITESFDRLRKDALSRGGTKSALVLFIDEADALAQSREAIQMHHEDKAGVNALIRGIDSMQGLPVPVLVIMCTNRHSAIDPAVRRRSAATFEFNRPNQIQCAALLKNYLGDINEITSGHFTHIASLCVPHGGLEYGYTYSDLTQRVLPTILLSAFPDKQITLESIEEVIKNTPPTSPFTEYEVTQ